MFTQKFIHLPQKLVKHIKSSRLIHPTTSFSSGAPQTARKERLLIGCKRKEYDFYAGQKYDKFEEIVLASKGWNHNKSKGDNFVVYPNPEANETLPGVPLDGVNLHENIKMCLRSQNITELTAFQMQAIDTLKQGHHAILAAETGCGKTLAYLLPIIQDLIGKGAEEMNTPKVLILMPSRELAYQVGAVAQILTKCVNLNMQVVVGGRTKKLMLNPQFGPIDLLIGTPGAISKLSTVGVYRLKDVVYTVLDESDTLIDDSFIERVTGLIKRVSQSQLALVSATLSKSFPPILEPYEADFKHVISPMLHKPLCNVTQRFLRLIRSSKPSHILQIAKNEKNPLLIFTNRTSTCNWLANFLGDSGLSCAHIHGDMHHAERIEQWNNFINGPRNILIATDVGSRGLDTTQIKHVVNYDFPIYAADYVHRVGRTGRLGSPEFCKITNFISGPEEVRLVQNVEMSIRRNETISNIDGNITRILQKKIARESMKL